MIGQKGWEQRVIEWWRRSNSINPMALIEECQEAFEREGWEPIQARNQAVRDFVIVCERQARRERQTLRREMRNR